MSRLKEALVNTGIVALIISVSFVVALLILVVADAHGSGWGVATFAATLLPGAFIFFYILGD